MSAVSDVAVRCGVDCWLYATAEDDRELLLDPKLLLSLKANLDDYVRRCLDA